MRFHRHPFLLSAHMGGATLVEDEAAAQVRSGVDGSGPISTSSGMALPDWIVLREVVTLSGPLQLIAYHLDGATWIGAARGDGVGPEHGLLASFGLRTGTTEHEVTGTICRLKGVDCFFGAVTRRIVRAKVLQDSGAVVPAEIVELPRDIEKDYRAVWAIFPASEGRGELVGYDDRDRRYDEADPRNDGPMPTDEERIAAVRRHAEDALRYYATALLTDHEHHKLLEGQMYTCAYFLAILEADATDPRTVMGRRQKLIERFLEEVKTRPWTPPRSEA